MKRMIYLISFLLLTTVLAGCISIPFGDEVMKISMDGVEFVDKEGEDEAENNNANNEEFNDESNNNEVDTEVNNEENESSNEENNSNDATNDGENNAESNNSNTGDATAECEEQDHSEILENLPPDFYIPECAEVTNIKDHSMYYRVIINVEGGDWKEIFEEYKEFYGDLLEGHEETPNEQIAKLNGKLLGPDEKGTSVNINQKEEDVALKIEHFK